MYLKEVTSLAEVWIEIMKWFVVCCWKKVTSLAEVWIEIWITLAYELVDIVTSLAEVWIEIFADPNGIGPALSHFPCGSVD